MALEDKKAADPIHKENSSFGVSLSLPQNTVIL
jgi:hypothetical protein